MSDLDNDKFKISEQKPIYEEYYSYFLNELISIRKSAKCPMDDLALAFKCSKGTISYFESRIKNYDFIMLFNYASFFRYNLEMTLRKMTYREKLNI